MAAKVYAAESSVYRTVGLFEDRMNADLHRTSEKMVKKLQNRLRNMQLNVH